MATGGTTQDTQSVGAEAIIDAVVTNTPVFVRSSTNSAGSLKGSLVLNNIKLSNVPTAVGITDGTVVLAGGSTTIDTWGQGDIYSGTGGSKTFTQGTLTSPNKASSLLDSAGRIFGRTRPQYADYAVSQFVSARDQGCKGDGTTDDTAAIKALFAAVSLVFSQSNLKPDYEQSSMPVAKSSTSMPAPTLWYVPISVRSFAFSHNSICRLILFKSLRVLKSLERLGLPSWDLAPHSMTRPTPKSSYKSELPDLQEPSKLPTFCLRPRALVCTFFDTLEIQTQPLEI